MEMPSYKPAEADACRPSMKDSALAGTQGRPTAIPGAPPYFHVMAKPAGAMCNLNCSYCFFLAKEKFYPGSRFRMSDQLLDTYLRQYIEAQRGDTATIAWQGGEPTLMGLDFFRRSIDGAQQYARPGVKLEYTIQTNGTLLDDEWCAFLKEHGFLVGLSIDGPRPLHDAYRVDKRGRGTFDRVVGAANLLKQHGVDFNVLATVHAANADHPLEVYRFVRDELRVQFLQLIPIVERINRDGRTLVQEGDTVTERSVKPDQWGRFLIAIFDEWVRHDVGDMYLTLFESALASWLGMPASLCIFAETCGEALALEHNGDLYSCDHFVEPDHLLGNIRAQSLIDLVASPKQRAFGAAKRDGLPQVCLECNVRFACNGECPKNRFRLTPSGQEGLNYLCAGYKAFFTHINGPMQLMAELYRRGRSPGDIVPLLGRQAPEVAGHVRVGRNDLCPCGSGRKYKQCHGRSGG